jgi:hypothetical protein
MAHVLVFTLLTGLVAVFGEDNPFILSREEAKHILIDFPEPLIVSEFLRSKYASFQEATENDFLGHHRLARAFCLKRFKSSRKKACTWLQYYLVIDHLREPFANLYDPGAFGVHRFEDIAAKRYSSCDVIDTPSAAQFYQYVNTSRPVIIRGSAGDLSRLASPLWTLRAMSRKLGTTPVAVSVSPTSAFHGPEDGGLWGRKGEDILVVCCCVL